MIMLDSSFMVSYEIADDSNNEKAKDIFKRIESGKFGRAFVTDYVFDETVTVSLVRSKSVKKSVEIGNRLKESMELLKIDELAFDAAWRLFSNQKRTKLSFTDCTTLSMMHIHGIDNLATFDKEFNSFNEITVIDK